MPAIPAWSMAHARYAHRPATGDGATRRRRAPYPLVRMKQLAHIAIGSSDYDERLWTLLEESGLERDDFESLDYFSLLPFFVIAGASVRADVRAHDDHSHFEGAIVEVPEELEDAFFTVLPQLLEQLTEED